MKICHACGQIVKSKETPPEPDPDQRHLFPPPVVAEDGEPIWLEGITWEDRIAAFGHVDEATLQKAATKMIGGKWKITTEVHHQYGRWSYAKPGSGWDFDLTLFEEPGEDRFKISWAELEEE